MPLMTDESPAAAALSQAKLKIEFSISDVSYHLVPHNHDFLDPNWFPNDTPDVQLATVISCPPDTPCTTDFLTTLRKTFTEDDVWSPAFLQNIIIIIGDRDLTPSAKTYLQTWTTTEYTLVLTPDRPPSGPYVLALNRTWQPWRIYPDHNQTMMLTFRPGPANTYEEYASAYSTGGTSALVPSRVYSSPGPSRPLSGLRFAIKDMFDVAGHTTSCGSRAYAHLSGRATTTAPSIQRLIDLGAVLVGKLKLATFVIRELPGENFDFAPPWNPRGCGYLTPGESSSGSGAAIVSYPWLDMAVASDTNGSSRVPVFFDGCHGIRLSTDALPRDGMLGFFPLYDAPALFTRDMDSLTSIASTWLSSSPLSSPSPSPRFNSILIPSEYTASLDAPSLAHFTAFTTALSSVLKSPLTPISLSALWDTHKPATPHAPLEPWLAEVAAVPYFFDAVKAYRSFAEKYRAQFGRDPYLNAEMQWRWERVKGYSPADRDALFERLMLYKTWLLERVFDFPVDGSNDGDGSGAAAGKQGHGGNLLVYPVDTIGPVYRDHLSGAKTMFAGLDAMNICPIIRGAEVSVTVGETEYASRVSGNLEKMPFAVSVIGRPGCDVQLLELVTEAMEVAGLPSKVATGKSIYFQKQ